MRCDDGHPQCVSPGFELAHPSEIFVFVHRSRCQFREVARAHNERPAWSYQSGPVSLCREDGAKGFCLPLADVGDSERPLSAAWRARRHGRDPFL
jgi:hypothetical protein